jgi:hypothetical protein
VFKRADGEIGNRHSAEILALEDLLNGVIEELGILENPGAANSLLGVLDDQSGLEYKTLIESPGIAITHAAGSITLANNYSPYFNGTFRETFNALVASDGVTITLTLQQAPTGDLIMQFSSGAQILDCTSPAQTIELTEGTDAAPVVNYIYIPESTKVVTKSISNWPAGEHIKIAYCLVPSATFVQDHGGGYINQNWNDHLSGADNQGHMSHIAKKIRRMGATWFSGVSANGATASYFTLAAGSTLWKSTAGVISQMHEQGYMAQDMAVATHAVIVNDATVAYAHFTDLYSITEDSTGTPIQNNRYFNLVFWGVANKTGEFSGLMVNLPGGFYTLAGDAEVDANGYDVYNIPREFNIDSGTAFLICRTTFKMGNTWTHIDTVDLRGQTPHTVSGGGGGGGDHGGLAGLGDVVDHPGYLLVDGTRNLTGNMAVDALVTIDGRDLSVDGSKLDGIETSADVTDATNVAASGALMADGTQNLTGNLTTDNLITIDGRDLSVDGSKLDGVENSADVTDATNVAASGALMADGTQNLTGNLTTDNLITIDGRDLSVDGSKLDGVENSADVTDATNVAASGAAMVGGAFHDGFSDSVADEHVLHAGVSVSPGTGLSGGGNISATRTLSLSHLGLENLIDPAGDRILFWDNSAGALKWLWVTDYLDITDKTLSSKSGLVLRERYITWDFEIGDFTLNGNWHDLDLSGIVPVGAYAVYFRVQVQGTVGTGGFYMAETGVGTYNNIAGAVTQVADKTIEGSAFVKLDGDRKVRYWGNSTVDTKCNLIIRGWTI